MSSTLAVAKPAMTEQPSGATLKKRSLSIHGHRTSVTLERALWARLDRMATTRGLSVSALVAEIDAARDEANLSSALRVAIVESLDQ